MNVLNSNRLPRLAAAALPAVLLVPALAVLAAGGRAAPPAPRFAAARDLPAEAREYIKRADVPLPPELQKVRDEVLSKIPAPCCAKFSAATCCCPCNLAKSIWGLSNTMLVKHKANSKQLREAVLEWIRVNNSGPWSGDACFTGGCGRPFAKNGCGGMNDRQIVF
ncbi:MAG: hypothetical protein ACM3JH_13905 [Acidithiobacillales bacterium]